MEFDLSSWLNLFLRWFHVILGITWIGQTYLFNWLEKTLTPPPEGSGKRNVSGELWMVHGGGFYLVEKQTVPEIMPRTLHWFKWESALTWISGMLLLFVVYYAGGIMVEIDSELSPAAATGIGLGTLAVGWLAYDLLTRLKALRNDVVVAVVAFPLVLVIAYLLGTVLSARAATMHIGAMFGTIMAANVWLRILPAQRQMLAATRAGEEVDMTLALRAKRSSKHNTYMSVPLIFVMLSSHYPTITYGNDHNIIILGALILLGWGGAHLMRR